MGDQVFDIRSGLYEFSPPVKSKPGLDRYSSKVERDTHDKFDDFLEYLPSTQVISYSKDTKKGINTSQQTDLVSNSNIPQDNTENLISLNANQYDSYDLILRELTSSSHSVIHHDNTIIADIIHQNGKLVVKSHTDKQLNLIGSVKCDEILVQSNGPVLADSKIDANKVIFDAAYLAINQPITATESLLCKSSLQTSINAKVYSKSASFKTPVLVQTSEVRVSEQLSIDAVVYKQDKDAITVADGFELFTDQTELLGSLTVKGKNNSTFIAGNNILCGDVGKESTISLSGKHHIHIKNINLRGDAQLGITGSASGEDKFIVDGNLDVNKDATLDIINTQFFSYSASVNGEFTTENSLISANQLYQSGQLESTNSTINIADEYIQFKDSSTVVNNCKLNSKIINSSGKLDIKHSGVDCNLLFAESKQIKISNSRVIAHDQFKAINGVSVENDSSINADRVYLSGDCNIDGLYAHARSEFTFNCGDDDQLTCKNLTLDTDLLKLKASSEDNEALFENSSVVFGALIQSGKTKFSKSLLTSIKPELSHSIEGHVELDMSSCSLANQVFVTKGGKLSPGNLSSVQSKRLWNQGEIQASKSTFNTDELLDQGKSIGATQSNIRVSKSAVMAGQDVTLGDESKLQAENIYHNTGALKLSGKSHLDVVASLFTNKQTSANANESLVRAKNIMTLGSVNLKQSLLSSQELAIYNTFGTSNKTAIFVQEEVTLAELADATIDQSTLSGKRINSSGKMTLSKSLLKSDKDLTTWSMSKTTLAEGTQVVSDGHITIHGNLQADSTEDDNGNQVLPSIKAKEDLRISKVGKVTGEGITTDSTTFYQDGSVDLSSKFVAKGKTLHNTGSTSASSMMLGFDHEVFNTGTLSADNLTIHSNFFNILGLVDARQTFSSAGLINFNAGAIFANNANQDSLLSFNAGFTLPNFSADSSYIFSKQNLTSFGRTLLTNFMPEWSSTINLGFSLPKLYQSTSSLLSIDWSKLKDMRQHEIMPWLCQIKSVFTLGCNAFNSVQSSFGEFSNGNFSSLYTDFSNVSLTSLGASAATIFGGSYTNNSLFNLNSGLHLGLNNSFTDFMHINSGAELGIASNQVDTFDMFNFGISGGMKASYNTRYIYNAGEINGINRLYVHSDKVENQEYGLTQGSGAVIDVTSFKQKGTIKVSNGFLNIDELEDSVNAKTDITNSSYQGKKLETVGDLSLNKVDANINNVNFTADSKVTMTNTRLLSDILTDESQLKVSGQNLLDTSEYKHSGKITLQTVPQNDTKNIFCVNAKKAELTGQSDIDSAIYEIEHFAYGSDFVAGSGSLSSYQFSDSLGYTTGDALRLKSQINRDANIFATASAIDFSDAYDKQHTLSLTSTQGDIKISGKINSQNFYADSAVSFSMNNDITTSDQGIVNAKGGFYDLGGTLKANLLGITAKEVQLVKAGPSVAGQNWELPLGSTGQILGDRIFLEATSGDIANYDGVIKANDYAQLLCSGDVLNICNERSYQGAYDVQKAFDAAIISGGNGTSYDGLGLYIKVNGSVVGDAAIFASDGSNYIEGAKGIELKARSHTYVSRDEIKRKHWGFSKEHIVKTSTTVGACSVQSATGRNIINSGDTVHSVATLFASPGGTDIYAQNKVSLFSLKTQTQRKDKKESFWGLASDKSTQKDEYSMPTLFIDNGLTRVHSYSSDIDARGALFVGAGDLELEAAGRIKLGRDILNHSRKQNTFSIGLSTFGVAGWDAYNSGQGAWGALCATDKTLGEVDALSTSNNSAEYLANGVNLGLNTFNTASSLMGAYADGNLLSALESRYGLGGKGGLDPTINISYNHTRTNEKHQTLGAGGINREGDVKTKAGKGIDLENGVEVRGKNIEIDAPEINANAAELKYSYTKETQSAQVGVTAKGNVVDAGGSASKQSVKATNYVNAGMHAAGNLNLHSRDSTIDVNLDGANITADSLDANIGKLSINDKQDKVKTKNESASLNASGQVSAYYGKGEETKVAQTAGIHVNQGINTDDHKVHIKDAKMVGGAITTDGKNRAEIDRLTAVSLEDNKSYTGVGSSFNVSESNTKEINTATINIVRTDYQAVRRAVVSGATGSTMNIPDLQGDLVTDSANGVEVVKDQNVNLVVDLPLATGKDIRDAFDNVARGAEKISEDEDNALGAVTASDSNPADITEIIPALNEAYVQKQEVQFEQQVLESVDDNEQKINDGSQSKESNSKEPQTNAQNDSKDSSNIDKVNDALDVVKNIDANSLPEPGSEDEHKLLKALYMIGEELAAHKSDKIIEALGESSKGLQAYFKVKGTTVSALYNLLGEAADNPNSTTWKKIENVTEATLEKIAFDKFLSAVFGKYDTPIGITITGLQVVDTLTYNQKYVDDKIDLAKKFCDDADKLHEEIKTKNYGSMYNPSNFFSWVKDRGVESGMRETCYDLRRDAHTEETYHKTISNIP